MVALALLALIPLILTGPAAAALSIALIKRGRRRALWVVWGLLACATVLLGITIAHTFGDFFPEPPEQLILRLIRAQCNCRHSFSPPFANS